MKIANNIKVRCPNCHEQLTVLEKSWKCNQHHCYDISKEGYTNLLQNVSNSGDNKLMVEARKNFLNKGYFKQLAKEIVELIAKLNIQTIIDIGCGEGYYDRIIYDMLHIPLVGVDISKEAIKAACRQSRNSDLMYFVANGYDIPFFDSQFELIINIFAPHYEQEFGRVNSNYFLKVVPNKEHLRELKEFLYDEVIIKDAKIEQFTLYELVETKTVKYKIKVDDVNELFMMTPYYYKTNNNYNISFPSDFVVTCDFTILLYKKIIK